MLMTLLSLQTRLKTQLQLNKLYDYTRFKGLKLNTGETKVMITFSSGNSTIPTFTYDSTPLELVLNSNTLESLLLVMEACSQLLRRWQTTSGLPLPEFTELVTARVSNKENMQCYDFSRSLLWQLVCTLVKYGPLLLWHMISQKSPPHIPSPGLPEKPPGCQEKHWYSLRAPQNRSDALYF